MTKYQRPLVLSELHESLFIDSEKAKDIGTFSFPGPTFQLYESDALVSVGLCDRVKNRAYPFYLPRPFSIDSVQALSVRLSLVQYYDHKGWAPGLCEKQLISANYNKNTKYGGGFIIGDGTGVGKTREVAAFLVSVIMAERAVEISALKYAGYFLSAESEPARMPSFTTNAKNRNPFFIWLTCSKSLFKSCQDDMKEVVTLNKK